MNSEKCTRTCAPSCTSVPSPSVMTVRCVAVGASGAGNSTVGSVSKSPVTSTASEYGPLGAQATGRVGARGIRRLGFVGGRARREAQDERRDGEGGGEREGAHPTILPHGCCTGGVRRVHDDRMARSPLPPPPEFLEQGGVGSDGAPSDTALRVQILATEHWSLLASRSTTQSEVLTRIAMFLTFVSASLLSLALVGNATQFTGNFTLYAVAILSVAVIVGVLTQFRVANASMEDLMYVVAMNRLRASTRASFPASSAGS